MQQLPAAAPSPQGSLSRFVRAAATSAILAGLTTGAAVAVLGTGGVARAGWGVVAAVCLVGCGWSVRVASTVLAEADLDDRGTRWLRSARGRADAGRWAVLGVALVIALACLTVLSGLGAPVWGAASAGAILVAAAVCWVWVGTWRARARDAEIRTVHAEQARAQVLQVQARQHATTALRMTLLRNGFDSLTPVNPGTTVLRPGEVVHLMDRMHFSRLDVGRWVAAQWCPVLVTNERIVARTHTAGELSFWWHGVTAIVPTAVDVELHFDIGIPLRLGGDSAELVGIYATARCRGITALNP